MNVVGHNEGDYSLLIKQVIVSLLWVELSFNSWLCIRQIQKISYPTEIPPTIARFEYSEDDFLRSKEYNRQLIWYKLLKGIYLTTIWTAVYVFSLETKLWTFSGNVIIHGAGGFSPDSVVFTLDINQNALFSGIMTICEYLMLLLPSLYYMFDIEMKHKFYASTRKRWISSYLKQTIIKALTSSFFGALGVWGIKILETLIDNQNWIILAIIVIIFWLSVPTLCAEFALSGKSAVLALPDGDLKTRIEALAKIVDFPVDDIFVSSKMTFTSHSNAFHYGFLKFNRLILYSSIIEGYPGVPSGKGLPPAQVVAIAAHEMGHFALSHSYFSVSSMQLEIVTLVIVLLVMRKYDMLFRTIGVTSVGYYSGGLACADPIIPQIFILTHFILQLPFCIATTLSNIVQKRMEYRADEFACNLGLGGDLQRALIKVSKDNSIIMDNDDWYEYCLLTHPSMLRRIERMDIFLRNRVD